MKILMITPYVPYPPASGGQIRTLNLLKHLHKKHYVTLVALSKSNKDLEYIDSLRAYCDEVHICERPARPWQFNNIVSWFLSTKPFLVVRNYSPQARKKIESLLLHDDYDVIHCETFYVMQHVPPTDIPILLVEQTIELEVYKHFVDSKPWWLRSFLNFDIMKLRFWEAAYWRKAQLVATVSEDDRQRVMQIEPRIDPIVVPNGAGEDMVMDTLPNKTLSHPTLLFQGNFSWLQNSEAAQYLIEHIVPDLIQKHPTVKLRIAGQHANKISPHPHVEIVEIANDDIETVRNLYLESSIFLAPIFGPGGTRLKILAAMASGLPVVSTSTGVSGLEVVADTHVLLANTPAEFVTQITRLLTDATLYNHIREQAFTLIHEKYNWSSIATELEVAYTRVNQ